MYCKIAVETKGKTSTLSLKSALNFYGLSPTEHFAPILASKNCREHYIYNLFTHTSEMAAHLSLCRMSTTHLRERPCTQSSCRLDCRERPCTQSTAREPVLSIAQVVAMTIHCQPLIPVIRRRTCESARALDRCAVSICRQVVVTQRVQSTTLKTCGLKESRLST